MANYVCMYVFTRNLLRGNRHISFLRPDLGMRTPGLCLIIQHTNTRLWRLLKDRIIWNYLELFANISAKMLVLATRIGNGQLAFPFQYKARFPYIFSLNNWGFSYIFLGIGFLKGINVRWFFLSF